MYKSCVQVGNQNKAGVIFFSRSSPKCQGLATKTQQLDTKLAALDRTDLKGKQNTTGFRIYN